MCKIRKVYASMNCTSSFFFHIVIVCPILKLDVCQIGDFLGDSHYWVSI